MTRTTVQRRTFEARQHPEGSDERQRLNYDARTSEYMPSYRYWAEKDFGDSRISHTFTTKAAAVEWVEQS